jgi:hypothetical protein
MLVLFLMSALPSISALEINAPEEVIIEGQEKYFLVEITNTSEQPLALEINFYAPTETQVSAPKQIAGNSKVTAKIFVKNPGWNKEINSKLEVFLDEEKEETFITLKFNPNQAEVSTEQITGAFTALFGLNTFLEEATNFGSLEYVLLFVLILVAAVLLIAFIARITKRLKK